MKIPPEATVRAQAAQIRRDIAKLKYDLREQQDLLSICEQALQEIEYRRRKQKAS